MVDVHELLCRQTAWQKSRRALSWPEKIRMVEAVRDSILALRATSRSRRENEAVPPRGEK
jgi:hypothetical protein